MATLLNMALMEGKQRYSISLYPDKKDIESYKKLRDIQKDIENFVNDGKNLLIYSVNCGNGKSEWAKKLILQWFNSIWSKTDMECRGMYLSMPKLFQSMKDNISKENDFFNYVKENVYKADLIVWDEINYKEWTEFEQSFMLDVISQRVAMGKSNIYTTNYDLKTIEEKLGNRLASRIVGCSELIEFVGADKRGISK